MLFNSLEYIIFLPLVFVVYWCLFTKLKHQNILLLVASYIFYGWWDWRFLFLIIFSSLVDYLIGLKIFHTQQQTKRQKWLIASLVSNLGILSLFKYFNFFSSSLQDMLLLLGWQVDTITLNLILPIGISFYTFQTLSYTIDIYRGNLQPSKNIISFFLYVSFFPQLVAGPIERGTNLLPQINAPRIFKYELFKAGLFQIFIGLVRKMVIADSLGVYVDSVYGYPEAQNSTTVLVATIFYAFQIYFDFAGYSDIAIGSAKLLGFHFNQNFNLPYFSQSITEFWRRWHISLSFWLRDYLYISLGGNRKGITITYRNLMLTMLLGGLWHGSSWNFVIWGGIHGIALIFERFLLNTRDKKFGWVGCLYTFLIVLVAWVFFRAKDLKSALFILNKLFEMNFALNFNNYLNLIIKLSFFLTLGVSFDFFLFKKKIPLENIGKDFSLIKLIGWITLLILMLTLFYSNSENFIYFQF
ncbi:MBOAT family O-acyltransferase [uncultured Microscilla sp.]|uniref:MBOAT family O-acyltransferase n=1 Tax=uncultured Microscilla sp. TaxID=432653 RepID=UPI00260F4B4B|nr:MBOAT family O-acyltransferase [uncultured Microscilla sp.]